MKPERFNRRAFVKNAVANNAAAVGATLIQHARAQQQAAASAAAPASYGQPLPNASEQPPESAARTSQQQ